MSASDSDSSEHGEIHLNSIREQLKECLSFGTAPKNTSFMIQGARNSYPNPGVNIKGIGDIGLPISPRDIDAVKQASHRAIFGKGSETIVDEDVRKTWQIDAADLSFLNSRWESWVQEELLPRCCKALGVPEWMKPDIRAELYKMLVYQEGAHFKPHKDTEKTPGMFATLAICLPIEHEGGDLVVTHNETSLSWSSSSSSTFDMSFAMWYAKLTTRSSCLSR